jgi:hypothetical protein
MNEKEPKLSEVLQIVRDGFTAIEAKMANKDDLAALGTELDAKMDTGFTEVRSDIAGIRADIVSLKHDVADVKAGSFTKMEKEDLLARVKYIEDDLGIESGM